MNIVCIPYHDWRKISKEGARTRDSHFIHHLQHNKRVEKLIIINRPTTFLEIFVKKNPPISGDVVLKRNGLRLYQVDKSLYVLDYITNDILGQFFKKKEWFFEAFGKQQLQSFFEECLRFLEVDDYRLLCQNVFANKFVENNVGQKSLFDAWDNFLLFPDNKTIEAPLLNAYQSLAKNSTYWVTNARKNVDYFGEKFGLDNITLIKNGVDFELFQKKYPVPDDMKSIGYPIIGFGGKITHLFDYEMFNNCLKAHPDKHFVVVGQILNDEVFQKIEKRPNFHYLGDKHYSQYPSYVTNFDVGIIPYVNNHLDSGADSIKAYEYLASGLSAIGSKGAGMGDLSDYMFVAADEAEFCDLITTASKEKKTIALPNEHSWKYKTEALLNTFEA